MSTESKRWFDAMKAKGHMPYVNSDGSLDDFVLDYDHHNGPGCQACGWSVCHHCEDVDSIPECDVLDGSPLVKLEPSDER